MSGRIVIEYPCDSSGRKTHSNELIVDTSEMYDGCWLKIPRPLNMEIESMVRSGGMWPWSLEVVKSCDPFVVYKCLRDGDIDYEPQGSV